MNKVKHLAFGITGALLVTAGLISCDNDEVTAANEEKTTTGLKAKGMSSDMTYQDFYLGQVMGDKDETNLDIGDHVPCMKVPGDCLPEIIINVPGKKTKFLQLISEPTNYQTIFSENAELLAEDFHPTLVNGVIDGFFKLETLSVDGTNTTKFRFKRVSDDVLVGTYQFIID